jgi:hypothetical protein
MDQRLVAEVGESGELPQEGFSLPVKHLGRIIGSEDTLAFEAESVVYSTRKDAESRTWRYSDIDSIGNSGQVPAHHRLAGKEFQLSVKATNHRSRHNQLWLQIEKKNGRIQ